MSNQNLCKAILEAYKKYLVDKKIESLQYVLESSVNAMEGIEVSL